MFNSEKPNLEELPSSKKLLRSTIVAAVAALAILVTIVLPAEYGIDPTGVGRVLGLTEMGEIKQQLQFEAEQDRISAKDQDRPGLLSAIQNAIVGTAHAQESVSWKDEFVFTVAPDDTHELKLTMQEGDAATYLMVVEGGRINFDLHGHGGGQSITYDKERGSKGAEGNFVASFPGDHGWFWRNRDDRELTVRLFVKGEYSKITQKQ